MESRKMRVLHLNNHFLWRQIINWEAYCEPVVHGFVFLCLLVYENGDVRFKGDTVHVGFLHGNRDTVCELLKYILVDGLSDVTCQSNE